ncbi:MAG: hypothetical protein GX998_06875 [Firmicutes bacterium]|nr:hypothetical protein [Bacillota bacterium]
MRSSYRKPNIQRLLTAFNGGKADRVPNFEVLIDNPTIGSLLGRPSEHSLANIPPQDYIQLVESIGQDAIGLCFYDNPLRYLGEDGKPRPLDFKIRSREDWQRVLPVTMDHLADRFALLADYCTAVEGTNIGVFVLLGEFLTTTYFDVFGFENFMLMLYDDLELIEVVLETLSQYYAAVVKKVLEYDLSFLYIGDDVAYKSGLFFQPAVFRRVWIHRMDRLMAPAREKGIPIMYHSDGDIMEILPDLLDMGVNALNPIEPYGMDIRAVRKRFGNRLCLVGNLDVGGNLSSGTPADVRAEAEDIIDAVGQDGAFVLASSHSITPNVPPENFLAMIETAHSSVY